MAVKEPPAWKEWRLRGPPGCTGLGGNPGDSVVASSNARRAVLGDSITSLCGDARAGWLTDPGVDTRTGRSGLSPRWCTLWPLDEGDTSPLIASSNAALTSVTTPSTSPRNDFSTLAASLNVGGPMTRGVGPELWFSPAVEDRRLLTSSIPSVSGMDSNTTGEVPSNEGDRREPRLSTRRYTGSDNVRDLDTGDGWDAAGEPLLR